MIREDIEAVKEHVTALIKICYSSLEKDPAKEFEKIIDEISGENILNAIVSKSYEADGIEKTMKLIQNLKNYPQRIHGFEYLYKIFEANKLTSEPDVLLFKFYLSELIIERKAHLEGLSVNLQNRFYALERKIQLFMPRAFDALARMIQAAGQESNYEEITRCAEKNSIVLNHHMDEIMDSAYDLTTVENLLNCIKDFPGNNLFAAYQSLFKAMKLRDKFYSSEVLMAAVQMRENCQKRCSMENGEAAFEKLINDLPKNVRAVAIHGQAHLKSQHGILHSPSPDFAYDSERLKVFVTKYVGEGPETIWFFETTDGGKTFYIKCNRWFEYLHVDPNCESTVNGCRCIYTWRNRQRVEEAHFRWKVELIGNEYVRLKSEAFNEFLLATDALIDNKDNLKQVLTLKWKEFGVDFETSFV